jgi:GNAT superfamily N-acetyltransferase
MGDFLDAAAGVEIRAYRPADKEGFARLVSSVLAEYGFSVDPVLEADLDEPQAAYDAIWVATQRGQVVGSVAMRLLGGGTTAELKRMYLAPGHRGRGLGRRLLERALMWAESSSCRTVVLDTSTAMTVAQHLYESAGFRRTGTRTEAGTVDSRCQVLYTLQL